MWSGAALDMGGKMNAYLWLKHKNIEAAKRQIIELKNMYRCCESSFRAEWHTKHDKHVRFRLREAVKGLRQYRNAIKALYKEIPIPLYIIQATDDTNGLKFYTYIHCPTCYEELDSTETKYTRCPWCGQALWWNDQFDETFDRYENGIYDGVHRRLIQR